MTGTQEHETGDEHNTRETRYRTARPATCTQRTALFIGHHGEAYGSALVGLLRVALLLLLLLRSKCCCSCGASAAAALAEQVLLLFLLLLLLLCCSLPLSLFLRGHRVHRVGVLAAAACSAGA
jgi:hypothetical protein